jgi:hypothetical protein
MVRIFEPFEIFPFNMVSVPSTVAALLKTKLSEVLFNVTLLKLVVPAPESVWSPAAVNDTVPLPAVIVPALVKSPFKVIVPDPKSILADAPTLNEASVVVPNVKVFEE